MLNSSSNINNDSNYMNINSPPNLLLTSLSTSPPDYVENQSDLTTPITPASTLQLPAITLQMQDPAAIFESSSIVNETTNFPPHQRNPIPFSVETPTYHENSMMQDHTYPQSPNNPSDANNDLEILKTLRTKYQNNPAIGYLNINSLRGQKFSQLEQITQINELDIFCIDETKLTSEIPATKFNLTG